MSNFCDEFSYKYHLVQHLNSPRTAEPLMKFIESCISLKMKRKMSQYLEKYAVTFGAVPPRFKNVQFALPYINKEIFEKLIEKIDELQIEKGKCYYLTTLEWLKSLNEDPEASDISTLEESYEEGLYFDPDPSAWEENFQIRKGLMENTDFLILGEELVDYFKEKYGGIFLKRHSYSQTEDSPPIVEIRLQKINIRVYGNKSSKGYFFISQTKSLEQLQEKVERLLKFRFKVNDYKLWKENLEGGISEIVDLSFGEEDTILVEFPDKRGKFSLQGKAESENYHEKTLASAEDERNSKMEIESSKENLSDPKLYELINSIPESVSQLKRLDVKWGRTGLQNLGNTCFMNSALQCLSNAFEFTNYFLRGMEKKEINVKNPLGTKGILAGCYAELMKVMWLGKSNSISPWDIKKTIGRHAQQFVGYGQQDSQEFLSYLLDLLHEDLNLIKNKPYIEAKDYDGTNDKEDSMESWINFKKRNDSVVTSLFYGQYKSTVTCSKCGKVSVTYDPFNVLSLPIGNSNDNSFTVYIVQSEISKPILKVTRSLSSKDSFLNSLEKVARQHNMENPFYTEIDSFKVNSAITSSHTIEKIKKEKNNVVVYEMSPPKDYLVKIAFSVESNKYYFGDFVLIPKLFWASKNTTFSEIYAYIKDCLKLIFENETEEKLYSLFTVQLLNLKEFKNIVSIKGKFPCFLCEREYCKGCEIKNCDKRLEEIMPESCSEINFCAILSSSIDLKKHNLHFIKEEVANEQKDNSLFSCLSLFTEPEYLDENNSWFCSRCKSLREASKSLEIMRVPEILIIHLKRFKITKKSVSFFGSGTSTTKINKEISYPLSNLNLNSYIQSSQGSEIYDLFGVSNHYGGMGGGHYTAFAKNIVDGRWYEFNDSRVGPMSESNIQSSSAYLLFYRRKRF